MLFLVLSCIAPTILHLLNIMFFKGFPSKLCTALLSVIPKSGNLLLPKNYRAISMQTLFANLYDQIIANRLMKWVKINPEQTAFQKGKGTVDQIFLLRLIIGLIKYNKRTLYIGFFDLSKAFEKVSRFLLLKTLVKMSIGTFMLGSLKGLYSTTRCILKCFGKVSDVFQTYTGIKQGASSSVIFCIAFMDEVIDVLKDRCVDESIIHNLHCLLHADDTLILSTDKDLFINKCNILIDSFQKKKMSTNIGKSGYMIINAGDNVLKTDLKLSFGWLSYKNHQKYLGVIICDTGKLINEMNLFSKEEKKGSHN